jgi:hypothetical protein
MAEDEPTRRTGSDFVVAYGLFVIFAFVGGGLIHQQPYRTFWPLAAGILAFTGGWGWRRLRAKRNKT